MVTVASILTVPTTGNASIATSSAIAHWACDETSGVRYDSTSNNNDLTDNNTVTYSTGVISNACTFTRLNSEYLSITDASQTGLDFTTDVSFSFWVKKAGDDNAQQGLFMKDANGANNTRSFALFYDDNSTPSISFLQFPTGYAYPNYYNASINNTFTDATWEHYVITVDRDLSGTGNTKYELFKNGTSQGNFTRADGNGATSFQDTGSPFYIGYGGLAWIEGFDGSLDEIVIFDNIINSSEISQLYNSGDGLTWPFSTTTTSTSTATTSTSTVDVEELKWVVELYLAVFMFLIFTFIGYRFTKMFI